MLRDNTITTPELTLRSVVIGLVLSVVMGAANVYLGLKVGMTVSASIPAAVVAMLILRGVLRTGSVLEVNQVQTAASAGESLAAGIIFTMPALLIIGIWETFDTLTTTVIAFAGGSLGVLFMIPMRRVFVTGTNPELTFPEGVACAAVIAAGDRGIRSGGRSIVTGTLFGAGFKALIDFAHLVRHTLEGATTWGRSIFYLGADISPALIAVGYIVRLNVALLIFIGGAIGWLIAMPLIPADVRGPAVDAAWDLWKSHIRYIGVGAMMVGGVAAIVRVRHSLGAAVTELKKRVGTNTNTLAHTDRDIHPYAIITLGVLSTLLIAGIYFSLTKSAVVTTVTTAIMLAMAFFFTAVASYIVGLVGNSNSPVSGMTITAVLFTGGLLWLFGFTGTSGMAATLGVAAIVCCAACTSGDVCNDLKTGQLVGASPFRQQIMQIAGVAVASFVMAPVMQLLHGQYTIGSRILPAPQAGLFASLAQAFFGGGSLPWSMVIIGAAVGVLMLGIDAVLRLRDSAFRVHLMPVAVGMYLPFGLTFPILFGGLLAHWIGRDAHDETTREKALRRGVLFASGVIAGESLMGVCIAILASLGIGALALKIDDTWITRATLLASFVAMFLFYRASCGKKNGDDDDVSETNSAAA